MRKALAVLVLTLTALPVSAADICPADPDTRTEKGSALTQAEFDQWLGNIQHVCQSNVTVTNDWDFGGGTLQVPNGTTLPASCDIGDSFQKTDADSGQEWYLCESADTWAAQGGTGSEIQTTNLSLASAQSVPNNTVTKIIWDTEEDDDGGWHTPSSGEIVIDSDGLYLVICAIAWSGESAGNRQTLVRHDDGVTTDTIAAVKALPADSFATYVPVPSAMIRASSGDTFYCDASQTSGDALDTLAATYVRFTVTRLGD